MNHTWVDITKRPGGPWGGPGAWCSKCGVSVQSISQKSVEIQKKTFSGCTGMLRGNDSLTKLLHCSFCGLYQCQCKQLGFIKVASYHRGVSTFIFRIKVFKWQRSFIHDRSSLQRDQ